MGKTTILNLRVNPDVKDRAEAINADQMTAEEFHAKLEKGYEDILSDIE